VIVIKFREGGVLKQKNGRIEADGLDLTKFYKVISQIKDPVINRILPFDSDVTKKVLEIQRQAREKTGEKDGSLELFVSVKFKEAGKIDSIVKQLNDDDEVELAYLSLDPADPPSSPDYSSYQKYLDPSPDGINARHAWSKKNGNGNNVAICDVEMGYALHEDLPTIINTGRPFSPSGPFGIDMRSVVNHGTNVQGVLYAKHNHTHGFPPHGIGVMGICPRSKGYFSLEDRRDPTTRHDAILDAIGVLQKGDVLLLECQWKEQGSSNAPIPVESDLYIFRLLTTVIRGQDLIVIEPAGTNGFGSGINLDDPTCTYGARPWQQTPPRPVLRPPWLSGDSSAIIVGGGERCNNYPQFDVRCTTSNFGSRVDCHAWGSGVYTTETQYDSAGVPTSDDYSLGGFGGTSSAGAIIAGAAACLQSRHILMKGHYASPALIRKVFREVSLGTPQSAADESANGHIGPMPDLGKVFSYLGL
jgi:hypothetical protein